MKAIFFFSLFFISEAALSILGPSSWTLFKREYSKSYSNATEEEFRATVFELNIERAKQVQGRNPLAKFGVNKFFDLTFAEFKRYYLNGARASLRRRAAMKPLPLSEVIKGASSTEECTKVDWRKSGHVAPVREQGRCGSCWAFASISNIESRWSIAGHSLVELSEQMLVSCAPEPNEGCNGGDETDAYEWLLKERKGQVVTRAAYPYVASNTACSKDLDTMEVGAIIHGTMRLPGNEHVIGLHVCAHGPVDLGVAADDWMGYKEGIITSCGDYTINHAVNIVGFDDTFSTPYWIIRNSWGPQWGEQGYVRIEKGSNQCSCSEDVATSIVKK